MSQLFLVRHAKAGSRSERDGADRDRPLTNKGRAQADVLADRLAPHAPSRVLSSPYVRCVQSVEPLAARCGLDVEVTEVLSEGADFEPALELLAALPDRSVLCSHGDLIPEVIEALLRRGADLVGQPEWRKGSVWVLERDGAEISRMEAWPPPD